MPLALKRYLTCLGIVCALMAMYATVICPWLQPPARAGQAAPTAARPVETVMWWSNLFATDAWQNQQPMVVQTEQGTLLFQKLEHIEGGANDKNGEVVRLSPLTLIIPMSSDAKSVAVGDLNASLRVYQTSPLAVVVAPEAELHFTERPDWASGSMRPISGGLLRGSIQIVGIQPSPDAATQATMEWSIRTSNIRIEGRRVWTNNDVELSAAGSLAIGKDLSIFLKRDLFGPSSSNDGPWGLLDHLELKSIKQVSTRLQAGGLWKEMKLGPPELAAAHAHLPAGLLLTCKGSFDFDFNKSIARLTDHVRIEHRYQDEPQCDEFLCHELSAQFVVLDQPARALAPDPEAILIGPMQLSSIDAVGIDSVGPLPAQNIVEVKAPNIATGLSAKRLQIQLDKKRFNARRFILQSHNGRSSDGSRSAVAPVQLNYMGTVFRAPSLNYAMAPDGQHLGWLLASGPGEVHTSNASSFGQVSAGWQKSLSMQPAEQWQLITLEGQALLSAAQRGHLGGDRVDVALKQLPGSTPGETSARLRVEKLDAVGLDKLAAGNQSAKGEVVLGNSTQNVRVKKLHLDFLYPESPTPSTSDKLDLNDAAGRPMRSWIQPPLNGAANLASPGLPPGDAKALESPLVSALSSTALEPGQASAAGSPAQPPLGLPLMLSSMGSSDTGHSGSLPGRLVTSPQASDSAMPVLVLGKELHSQIIVASPKPWIDNLIITGPVVISRDGPPTPDAPTWRVAGNELRLASDPNDHYDMQIVGEPARISFGDGWIEGPIVRLNQRTGHVWMDQPGALCIPGTLLNKPMATRGSIGAGSSAPIPPQPLGSQQIEWLEPIKCRWQGRMLFNGLTANIEGKIAIDGKARTAPDRLLHLGGTCESLEVRMSERVNLGNPGETTATVQSITLRSQPMDASSLPLEKVIIRTAQTDLSGRRISLEEIALGEATYEVATNTIRGTGPGEIHSQHQSGGQGPGFLASQPAASSAGNPPFKQSGKLPDGAAQLQGLHLKFRDSMETKLTDKQLTFMGSVEIGMGPIQSLEQFIDLNNMRVLQLDQSLLSGDLLRIYDASDVTRRPAASMGDGAWEFEAMGNVRFENKSEKGEMAGRASRITYIQAKELLVIRGDGRIAAEIRMKPEGNSQAGLLVFNIWQGSINTRTLQQEGEFKIDRSQIVPRGVPLPDNWKTGVIGPQPVQPAVPAPGAPSAAPIQPAPAASPRPRDGLKDWLK